MPRTVKSNQPFKKYLGLFEVRCEEQEEVVVLGTFNATLSNQPNYIVITGTSSNSSKKVKETSFIEICSWQRYESKIKRHTGYVCKNSLKKHFSRATTATTTKRLQ